MTQVADRSLARKGFLGPVSSGGLSFAAFFFAVSVTPSMGPRAPEVPGALGGIVAALGCLLWWAVVRLVAWVGLPVIPFASRGLRHGVHDQPTAPIPIATTPHQALPRDFPLERVSDSRQRSAPPKRPCVASGKPASKPVVGSLVSGHEQQGLWRDQGDPRDFLDRVKIVIIKRGQFVDQRVGPAR